MPKKDEFSRRSFLQVTGAFAASHALSAVSAAGKLSPFSAMSTTSFGIEKTATTSSIKPLARKLARIFLDSMIKDGKKELTKRPIRIDLLDSDPADIFFGGAAEIYSIHYPFSFIDYRSQLKACFSSAVHFVTFGSGENRILVDFDATERDLALLDRWEKNPRAINRIINRINIPLSIMNNMSDRELTLEEGLKIMDEFEAYYEEKETAAAMIPLPALNGLMNA